MYVCFTMHISMYASECEPVCVNECPYVCVSISDLVCECMKKKYYCKQSISIQIYLYANWILVKLFGVPHGLCPLVKWG